MKKGRGVRGAAPASIKTPKKPGNLPLVLGPLPVDRINKALQLELDAGLVVLTQAVQDHAFRRHTAEYSLILPHVAAIVTNPLLVGDDLHNPGNIELIGRVATLVDYLLVAVCISPNVDGRYEVRSFFTTKADKVQRRKEKKFLFVA